jgi:two-component system chemotaxis sensor kinase CheA
MEGKETELDKTIIEAIKDPLTHLVRNAVDHGVERPEARIAAGKDPEGLLFLRAFHEGGQVNIEITDDGAGLDCKKNPQQSRAERPDLRCLSYRPSK